MDANAKNTRCQACLAKQVDYGAEGTAGRGAGDPPRRPARESCDTGLSESAQCLSVTEKYRDYLAEPEQDDSLAFMGHRGREGSRTPDGWQSQRSGRPRSYSPPAALEPGAANGAGAPRGTAGEDPGDDEAAYGSGEWAAAPWAGGPAARGPARGFPPVPGQPAPSYPGHDFDAWNDDPEAGDQPTATTSGQWDTPASTGHGATAHWDAAPVADWESTGTLDPAGAGDWSGEDDWGEPGRTGEWAGSQTGEWARADEGGHPGAGAGHLS